MGLLLNNTIQYDHLHEKRHFVNTGDGAPRKEIKIQEGKPIGEGQKIRRPGNVLNI